MLAARLGPEATTRLRRLLGQEDRRLTPRRPPPPVVVERAFAEPIGRTEDAEVALGLLLVRACGLLVGRGQGGRAFEASFFRTDGAVCRARVETSRPLRDPLLLARLFRDRLGALADPLDPGFGFDLIRLAVLVADPLDARQQGLGALAPPPPDAGEAALADLTDRLAARFGWGAVTRFAPTDTHDPHRASHTVPAQGMASTDAWPEPPPGEPPLRPLRLLRPPEPVEAMAALPDGPPVRFRWRGRFHEVALAEGPERLLPEWWRDPAPAGTAIGGLRDYWRVEDGNGGRFWIFRAGESPRWFLHGLFA